MTLRLFALRFALSAAIALTAAVGGGWKWESFFSGF
jgi:hypothetical protein